MPEAEIKKSTVSGAIREHPVFGPVYYLVWLSVLAALIAAVGLMFYRRYIQLGLFNLALAELSGTLIDCYVICFASLVFVGLPLMLLKRIYQPPFKGLYPLLAGINLWVFLWLLFGYGGINTSLELGKGEMALAGALAVAMVLIPLVALVLKKLHKRLYPLLGFGAEAIRKVSKGIGTVPVLIIFAAGLLTGVLPTRAGPARERPNIMFILVDALRADHMGLYGYGRPTSPFIDQWSKEKGIIFGNVYSTESYTFASVTSIFTSLYPTVHECLYFVPRPDRLSERHVTLAEILKNEGYQTMAIVFNPSLNHRFNLNQGFDLYDDSGYALARAEGVSVEEQFETARQIWERAGKWLEKSHRKDRPYFAYLHYRDVHAPYLPPKPYDLIFTSEPNNETRMDFERTDYSEKDREYMMAKYDAEIRYTDETIRKMLRDFEQKGYLENTIIILTADHGEEFYEKHPDDQPWYFHMRTLYQEQVRVPMVIFDYRLASRAGRIQTPVSLLDLAPTIIDMAGIKYKGRFQGVSLLPVMAGQQDFAHPPIFTGGNHGRAMMIEDGFKYYARNEDRSISRRSYRPSRHPELCNDNQLFYLSDDPMEKTDIIGEYKDQAQRMREKLLQWYEGGQELKFSGGSGGKQGLDPDTRERLRALGYIQE